MNWFARIKSLLNKQENNTPEPELENSEEETETSSPGIACACSICKEEFNTRREAKEHVMRKRRKILKQERLDRVMQGDLRKPKASEWINEPGTAS